MYISAFKVFPSQETLDKVESEKYQNKLDQNKIHENSENNESIYNDQINTNDVISEHFRLRLNLFNLCKVKKYIFVLII